MIIKRTKMCFGIIGSPAARLIPDIPMKKLTSHAFNLPHYDISMLILPKC